MNTPTPQIRAAVAILDAATRGTFAMFLLTGPVMANTRAQVMSAITGQKVPKSKAGITVLEQTIYGAVGVPAACHAAMANDFAIYARGVMNTPAAPVLPVMDAAHPGDCERFDGGMI